MRRFLTPHPDWPCAALRAVAVALERPEPGRLQLRYELTGEIGQVRLPPSAESLRRDGLWARTCFEAFLRPPGEEGYFEFNFAPSTEWAAYRFSGYREGMANAEPVPTPWITGPMAGSEYQFGVGLDLDGLHELAGADWRVGLSAVIEERDGRKSYWALAHPPGKADFHHPDCFALELPAPHRT